MSSHSSRSSVLLVPEVLIRYALPSPHTLSVQSDLQLAKSALASPSSHSSPGSSTSLPQAVKVHSSEQRAGKGPLSSPSSQTSSPVPRLWRTPSPQDGFLQVVRQSSLLLPLPSSQSSGG